MKKSELDSRKHELEEDRFMEQEAERRGSKMELPCVWHEIEEPDWGGLWETDCGEAWVFMEGGPFVNGMNYCCYCGRSLEEEPL